jgi:hypothetical protein
MSSHTKSPNAAFNLKFPFYVTKRSAVWSCLQIEVTPNVRKVTRSNVIHFEEHCSMLFTIAYCMADSAMEAEDIVQKTTSTKYLVVGRLDNNRQITRV